MWDSAARHDAWSELAELTGCLIHVMDDRGEHSFISRNHASILGYDDEAFRSHPTAQWCHPEDVERVRRAIGDLLAAPSQATIEYRVVAADGQVRNMVTRAGSAMGPDGRMFVLSVARDISDELERERSLREQQDVYRLLVDSSSDVLWIMDANLRTLFMSRAVEMQLGFTPEEYIAMPLEQRLPPESIRLVYETFSRERMVALERAKSGFRHSFTMRMKHRHKNGRLAWGELHASFIYDAAMNITGLHGVTHNIDAQVQAEEALARSEAHYRRFFEEVRAGIAVVELVFDAHGSPCDFRYIEVNPAYTTHSGLPAERVVGKLGSTLFTAGEMAHRMESFRQASGGRTLREEIFLPTLERWLDVTIWRMQADTYALMFEDTTAQRRMEEEVARASKLDTVGVLAGGIAHDFNNLLTGILGNISLVNELADLDARSRLLLESAEDACIRACGLTKQLLTFSRGGEPVKEEASLPEVLRQAADFVMTGSNVSCAYRFAPGVLHAFVDRGQIAQVVQNLTLNALQAMPGGGAIEIGADRVHLSEGSVPSLRAGAFVRFWVRDQGHGISPEHMKKIFDPFYSTRETGVGLGLPIAFSIVRKHSGAITVDTNPGRGTTFTVYLPAGRFGERDSKQVPVVDGQPGRRVLIMDDESIIREVLGRILKQFGYQTTTVPDGREAVEMYRNHMNRGMPFDIVLMDLTIPGGMGGKVAVREILAADPRAKVVVMSGYCTDPVMSSPAEHGFCAVLPKPIQMADLKSLVERLLANDAT